MNLGVCKVSCLMIFVNILLENITKGIVPTQFRVWRVSETYLKVVHRVCSVQDYCISHLN